MDVDTRLLRSFLSVVETGSVNAAASASYVSQPALTKQVSQLERLLGTALFTRTRTGMTPTPAGEALVAAARSTLAGWDDGLRAFRSETSRRTRVLRVGFVASAANEHTQDIVAEFTRRQPGWRVVMRQSDWSDPTAGLADSSVDVAILRLPIPDRQGLRVEVLFTEPRWVALPSGHRFASHETVDFAQLWDEPFVATPTASGPWRDYWLATDERDGVPPIIGAVAHTPDEWPAAIAQGDGLSLTPAATARFYQRPGVVYRPVTGVSASAVGVCWNDADSTPAVAAFVQACTARPVDASTTR